MPLLIALVFPAFIIFCIIIGEEDIAKSKYDERYVAYEDKVKLNSQDFDKLQDDNYFVQIMDNQGEIIYENLYMLEPVVEKIGENTVVVTVGRGDQWNTVFVNGQTGEVSETFGNVCAYNENIVVYGIYDGQLKIIIRDVYDTGNLYKEIIDNFPSVAVGSYLIKDAKVISDNFVYLNYYVSSDVAEDESTAKLIYIGDWRIGD